MSPLKQRRERSTKTHTAIERQIKTMNWAMAKEVGPLRYVLRRLAWRARACTSTRRIPYVLPGGQRIMLPPRSPFASDIYCTRGCIDWGSEQLLLDYLTQLRVKGICYDVGGNMGYYSVLLASVADHVFAFEPDPRNHADLLAQDNPKVTLVSKAVSDHCGSAHFDVSSDPTLGHLSDDDNGQCQIQVESITLDKFRESRPVNEIVSAVKMDVEGYEMSCLRGATNLAQSDRPVFLIEFGIEKGRPNSFPALGAFTAEHRYEIFTMVRRSRGPAAFHTSLEMTSALKLVAQNHKMIFLVPVEDTFFNQRASKGYCFDNQKGRP